MTRSWKENNLVNAIHGIEMSRSWRHSKKKNNNLIIFCFILVDQFVMYVGVCECVFVGVCVGWCVVKPPYTGFSAARSQSHSDLTTVTTFTTLPATPVTTNTITYNTAHLHALVFVISYHIHWLLLITVIVINYIGTLETPSSNNGKLSFITLLKLSTLKLQYKVHFLNSSLNPVIPINWPTVFNVLLGLTLILFG